MILESGSGLLAGPYTATTDGGEFPLPDRSNQLVISCDGEIRMYFTQEDYDADANYWPLLGDSLGTICFQAPISVSTLWLRAQNADSQIVFLIASQR